MKRGHGAFRAMRQVKIGTMVDIIFIVAQCPRPPRVQQAIRLNQQRLAAQKRRQTTMIAGFGIAFILHRGSDR